MSYTEIYSFNRDGFAESAGEVWNATRGAWVIWTTMEKRHLPPFTISGFTLSRLNKMDTAEEVWQLAVNKAVPEHERIVMLSTMDKCLVKKENLPKLIEAFRKFEGDTSLPEQADILEKLLADDDCIAVGWNQTSVSAPIWYRYDEEKDEEIPYNCLTGTDHFWLFADLNEEG